MELSIGQLTITSVGSLTIYCQTVNEGTITVGAGGGTAIDVYGSLTINGCTITANGSGSSSSYYGINVSGSVTVNGGSITANGSDDGNAYGINVSDGSSFTVNGGFVRANATGNDGHGINVEGIVTLNGGTVKAKATGDDAYGINVEGIVTLAGGTVTASSYNGNLTIANVCTYFDGTNTIDPGTSISTPADGATYQPEWTGSGTSDTDPILIKSTADLDLLAKRVNAGTDFSDTYFQLANDIWYNPNLLDDNEENYTAIGGQGKPFCGTFDGANHAIGGIRIYKDGTDDADCYQGLFGLVGTGGTVKNVILDNAWIAGYQHVGGIVGENAGGTVENCHVLNNSSIDVVAAGTDCHGDIAGSNSNSGTVTRCSSVAQKQNYSGSDNHQNHGGVVGSNSGTVSDCSTNGIGFDGSSNMGEIVGYNTGTVSNSYSLSGLFSLVGNNDDGTVTACGLAPQDTQDNSAFLTLMAQRTAVLTAAAHGTPLNTDVDITLYGRTLYKDGKWNTLCLPFSISADRIWFQGNFPGVTLMELDTEGKNGFDPEDGTLYLTFKQATEIRAGVPYLVKWDWDYDLTPPAFTSVTIAATLDATPTVTGSSEGLEPVQMVGCYSPVPVEANDKSILFLGEENTLYYSTVDRDIRSFRAYFSVPYIKQHAQPQARAFRLDFGDGDGSAGVSPATVADGDVRAPRWHTLDGRRLSGKPTKSGVYVSNGRKIVVK